MALGCASFSKIAYAKIVILNVCYVDFVSVTLSYFQLFSATFSHFQALSVFSVTFSYVLKVMFSLRSMKISNIQ